MKQLKNFMTKEKIKQELQDYDNEKHSQSPAHLEYMAQQYWDSKEYEEALYYINQAIELNLSQYAYYRRAKIYCKLNEYDNALEDLDTALSIEPAFDNAIELKELILDKIAEDKKYYGYCYG